MKLTIRSGKEAGQRVDLERDQLLIGSGPGCDLVLPEGDGVANRHAYLRLQDDGTLELRDLGSDHGTHVDGRRVNSCRLHGGETIRIGDVEIEVARESRASRLSLPRTRVAAGAAVATLIVAGGALAALGVFSGGPADPAGQAIRQGPVAGLPDVQSLTDVAGGVANGALPQLKARGGMETIMQDDAAFIYGKDDAAVTAALKKAKELGVDRIRLTAGWSILAPEADADAKPSFEAADPTAYTKNGWKNYDPIGHWQALDRAVRTATDAGMKVMIDVGFWAPKWATSGDPQSVRRTYNVNPAEYAEFVKAVVKRYSGDYVPVYGVTPPVAQQHSNDSDLLKQVFGPGGSSASTASTASAGDSGFPYNLIDGSGSGSGGGSGSGSGSGSGGGSTQSAPAPKPAGPPLPKVSLWTIWNEPNHAGFVQPQWRKQGSRLVPNSAHLYRQLVEAGYPAIKGLQPDSTVLVGATSSTGTRVPRKETDGSPPLVFLKALACVDDKLRPITSGPCANYKPLPGDGYSHHPYSLLHTPDYVDKRNPNNLPIGDLAKLTNTLNRLVSMRRIDPKIRNVYLTEFGYESNPPDPVKPWKPNEQAEFINWAEYLAWKNPNVRSFPQFLLTDMGTVSAADAARGKREYGDWQSGLFFNDGTPKPAATSFPLALHVDCTTSLSKKKQKLLVVWGHVRSGSGPRQVQVQSSSGKAAATAASLSGGKVRAAASSAFTTDASGYFLRFAPYKKGLKFKVASGGQSGLAFAPDTCTGISKQRKLKNAGANEF